MIHNSQHCDQSHQFKGKNDENKLVKRELFHDYCEKDSFQLSHRFLKYPAEACETLKFFFG